MYAITIFGYEWLDLWKKKTAEFAYRHSFHEPIYRTIVNQEANEKKIHTDLAHKCWVECDWKIDFVLLSKMFANNTNN